MVRLITHQLDGLTIQTNKIVMSIDQAQRPVSSLKGKKDECDQNFSHNQLSRRHDPGNLCSMVLLDRNLVKRPLPKDELQLSNFINNRDDFVFHAINRKMKREFFSVLRDDCQENLRKTKTEHFLELQLPGLHTYRLGGSNYLTAAGEVAYFYEVSTSPRCSHKS